MPKGELVQPATNHHRDHRQSERGSPLFRILALLLALALVAAACGSDDDDADGGASEAGTEQESDAGEAGGAGTEEDAGDEGAAAGGATLADDLPAIVEGAAQSGGTYGGTLRVAHQFPPISLDPHTGSSGADHQTLYSLYDRLVHFKFDSLEFTPGLATSWEFTDDTTLVLNLREGVTFHDGTPFNAEAVAYNIDRVQNHPNTKVPADLEAVESTEVIDDLTIQLNLNRPDSGVVGILSDRAGMMVSPTAAEAADEKQLDASPVGTGPFKLAEYSEGDRLLVERNEDYWQEGLPYLDGIEWLFSGGEQSAVNGLRAGDVDVALTIRDFSQVSALEGEPGINLIRSPSLHTDGCYINDEIPPWDDVRVRKAWSQALDRDTLADVFTFGLAEPAYMPVPPQHWSSDPNMVGVNGYDVEAAKALLAEAGHESVDVTILAYQDPVQIRKGELIQEAAAEAGFNVEIEVLELAASVPAMFTDRVYAMFCAPWTGRPDPSQTATSLFDSGAYYSLRDTDRAGIDALIAAAVASPDIAERTAAYADLWEVAIGQEALWTPLWHNVSISFTTDEVNGYQLNLLGKGQIQFAWLDQS
jgi:peptide/nickel transport system permease protein/peptide/nickel transport system substrate-binding protein